MSFSIHRVPGLSRLIKRPPVIVAVIGGGLGDEGKGAIVDFLAQRLNARKTWRVGSGSNPGHGVIEPFGRRHVFMQIPSGAFKQNPKTGAFDAELVMSKGMMFDPMRLANELDILESFGHPHVLERLFIHADAGLIMLYHVVLNRMSEVSTGSWKGSTGRGNSQSLKDVGEPDSLKARDLLDFSTKSVRTKLEYWIKKKKELAEAYIKSARGGNRAATRRIYEENLQAFDVDSLVRTYAAVAERFGHRIVDEIVVRSEEAVVLEWAQGINLHPELGTVPNTTPYDTTLTALKNGTSWEIEAIKEVVIVTRAYGTRHGPGFFPTEVDGSLAKFAHLRDDKADLIDGVWPLAFRVGWLDLPMLRNSIFQTVRSEENPSRVESSRVSLAVTNLDRFDGFSEVKLCDYYRFAGEKAFLDAAGVEYEIVEGAVRIMFFQAGLSATPEIRDKIIPHYITVKPGDIVKEIEEQTGFPVSIKSRGAERSFKKFTSEKWRKRLSRTA